MTSTTFLSKYKVNNGIKPKNIHNFYKLYENEDVQSRFKCHPEKILYHIINTLNIKHVKFVNNLTLACYFLGFEKKILGSEKMVKKCKIGMLI